MTNVKQRITDMWAKGLTSFAIGEALNLDPEYIRNIARRMGLPKRRAGRPRKLTDTAIINPAE